MKPTTTAWQRSSFCSHGACIEVAQIDGTVHLRDAKNPGQPALVFTYEQWAGFQHEVLAIGKSS
ncbi:hypothetical protein Ait01nite_045600 [Actinoplanes italicus]|uniref:Uncharacterized protein DUF397 n=1 Tax=Actinoplanes italicus TaxID=113567 RepID=A0A2T0KCR7_9ACTN|nr:DUF397 domain-containing protein [Actinoplanes italicus]PRX21039.1 uncharacterized protein DUF397 [Actinoplanes italicus]GIE31515.1 hypothetical protein Ait01nite_045600 [Actinoplanes italicus]